MFSCEFCGLIRNTYFVESLGTACSEAPARGSLFNKVTSQTAWIHWRLDRNSSTGISLRIVWNFLESFFCRTPPSNHFSHDIFFLLADQWGLQPKTSLFGGGMVNLHCQVVATHVLTEALEVEGREELKNLWKWGKFSFYVMVHRKILTYLKNITYLILVVNKTFKIFDF